MKLEVVDIKDNDDGSCTITLDMENEAIQKFASIGVLKALTDAAKEIIDDVDNFIDDVKDCTPEKIEQTVSGYIDDAIRILNEQPRVHGTHVNTIDYLNEAAQSAIQTLIVAKSLLDAKES